VNVITIGSLGNFGRFGNQLFQYAFARAMADRFDAVLQTPPWVGQRLFGLDDPAIDVTLPTLAVDEIPDGPNVDLHGYFQHARHLQFLSEARLKSMYSLLPVWKDHPRCRPHVAAHLRRGDYASRFADIYCIVSRQSYLRACERYGLDVEKMVWYSEESQACGDPAPEGLGFLPDFLEMMDAEVLLRANSTFSWWAGLLGNARVYSPLVGSLSGPHDVDFVEGNWPRMVWHQDDLILPP